MRSSTRIFHPIKIIFLVALSTLSQSKGSADPVSNEIVHFPDPQLEAAIREALDIPTGDITSTDLLLLTHFSAWNEQIEDITGIEYATNLTTLDLSRNPISDLTPLTQLTKLTELKLSRNNELQNLDFLRSLPTLTYLDLSGVGSASHTSPNFEVLNELTQLTYLNLEFSGISELSPLENLANLVELDLSLTQIENLIPLQKLTNLAKLNLVSTIIEDFTPLQGLANINYLKVSFSSSSPSNQTVPFNSLTDTLTHLTKLETLEIDSLEIEGVTQIANAIPNIKNLRIYYSSISDISALSYLTNLSSLSLEINEITDISPLANLTNLSFLNIDANPVQDISPLKNLTNLSVLLFGFHELGTSIDISLLADLTNLTSLGIGNTDDISPILNLTGLKTLYIRHSKVPSLELLTGFTNLKSLSVQYSHLKDITALSQLPQLETLILSNNLISDISAVSHQVNLKGLDIRNNYISDLTPVFQLDQLALFLFRYNLVRLEKGTTQKLALDAYIEKYPYLYISTEYTQQEASLNPISSTVTSGNGNYFITLFLKSINLNPDTNESPDPLFINETDWVSIHLLSRKPAYNPRGTFIGYNYNFEIEVEENPGNQPRSATVYIFGQPHTVIQNGNETPVVFQDQNLISALREILNKPDGDILEKDITGLTSLDLSNRAIIDLSGLEVASNLTSLNLSSNKITTLRPITKLLKIQYLDLSYNNTINYSLSSTQADLAALESIEGITIIIKSAEDSDGDGLHDILEYRIIDTDPNDNFDDLEDVTKYDDFDHDGFSNYSEQENQSDPSDFASPVISQKDLQTTLIPVLENNQIHLKLEIKDAPAGSYRLGVAQDLGAAFKGVEITPGEFTYSNSTQQTITIDLSSFDYSNSLFFMIR